MDDEAAVYVDGECVAEAELQRREFETEHLHDRWQCERALDEAVDCEIELCFERRADEKLLRVTGG